jgi:hypothetical protein
VRRPGEWASVALRAVIAGGGLGRLAPAVALTQAGIDARVREQARHPGRRGHANSADTYPARRLIIEATVSVWTPRLKPQPSRDAGSATPAGGVLRLPRLIRALRWIRCTGVPTIDHQARIHRLSARPAS